MRNIALVFGSILLSLGFIEAATRTLFPFDLADHVTAALPYHYDPELGWAGDSEIDRMMVFPESSFRVRTNALGFRDEEPEPGAILILGDSFAWGWGVEEDERFGEVLGQILGRRTVNVSLPGWGPDQELLAFRRHAAELRPSAIVLAVSSNDACDLLSSYRYGMAKPQLDDTMDPSGVPVPFDSFFWWRHGERSAEFVDRQSPAALRSHALRWARMVARNRLVSSAAPSCEASTGQLRAEATIMLIAEELRRTAPTVALLIPGLGERPSEGWRSRLMLALDGCAVDPGAAVLTPESHFRFDPHWTPAAHRVAAELLSRKL